MKRNKDLSAVTKGNNTALLLLRVGLGSLMLVHGIPKMIMLFSSADIQFPSVMGMSATTSLTLAVFAEVICPLLVIIGWKTRYAVMPIVITMLIAAFMVHAADPFAKQELALLYMIGFSALMVGGSGKYSVDYLLKRNDIKGYHPANKPEDPTVAIYQ